MRTVSSEVSAYPRLGYAWYVCVLLLLAYMVSFLDRSVIALLVIPIERDLAINDTQMSLLQGFSFALFYALLGLPIARIVDSKSRRTTIMVGIAFWSLATAACGMAGRFWVLFLARVGVGAGEATLLPGATSLVADYFPPTRCATALGIFATGIYFGSGIALVVGGILLIRLPATATLPVLGTLHAWQLVFMIVALPGLVLALAMLTVREPVRRGVVAGRRGLPIATVGRYLNDNLITVICHNLGFTFIAFASYAATAWIPTIFVRVYGWTAGEIGVCLGVLVLIVGPLGSVTGGALADRFARHGRGDGKFLVGLMAAIGLMAPAAVFPLMPGPYGSLAVLCPFMFFTAFVWGLAPASLQEIMPNQMRGQATALYTGVLNLIGLGLGPASVAMLADYGFHDPSKLNLSAAIIVPMAGLTAALCFRIGQRHYLATLERLADWRPVD